MRNLLASLSLAVATLVPARGAAQTFRATTTSKDGSVVVSWSVKDGQGLDVAIDTPKRKGAYRLHRDVGVAKLHVEFLDANGDGRPDVMVRYEDERGYSPDVLINRDDLSFVQALRMKEGFRVEAEPATAAGSAYERARWRLVWTPGRPTELVFYDVVIGKRRYRDATFRLDPRTLSYRLFRKGKPLGPVRGTAGAR
jgi:hypothetical protein